MVWFGRGLAGCWDDWVGKGGMTEKYEPRDDRGGDWCWGLLGVMEFVELCLFLFSTAAAVAVEGRGIYKDHASLCDVM